MPIVEKDPWRVQYFAAVACPAHVYIPTDDTLAWQLYPQHRWIYNKLRVAETQGLTCAPHDVPPPSYPVFSKPIYNLRGMALGTRAIASAEEYEQAVTPGHFWMPLLEGEHVSSDVVLIDGRPVWWRHAVGVPLVDGMFDYWTVLADSRPTIEARGGEWLSRHLRGYTGCVNLETLGGTIIEVHLRFADQWPDLYGNGWVDAVVGLYANGLWRYDDRHPQQGYSVALFGAHGPRYTPPPAPVLERWLSHPHISSIQITFDPDRASERHAMPPGGFRLAVINAWDLEAGRAARAELAQVIGHALALGAAPDSDQRAVNRRVAFS